MTMMAAMAQIETIIFFIILVPFVSFLYDYILPIMPEHQVRGHRHPE